VKPAPATIGRGLARSFAIATAISMGVFACLVWGVIYFSEVGQTCVPGEQPDPPLQIAKECGLALLLSLPVGIGLSVLLGSKLTHGTRDRLDEVISSASRMTGEKLDERLPVSPVNDPLDRLAVALNGVLERIESAVAAQRQFAADASHELRTPLTVISTNLEVARRRPREISHWEHVADQTLGEVRRMHVLVDKLLVLARSGAAGLTHARCDLRRLAEAAVERAEALARERNVRVDLSPGGKVEADVDADAIAIVLDNLLRNAIDHSPAGDRVRVSVERGPKIVVEDHGPGVPAEIRDRVFEPFARGNHTDRAVGTGMGLGLAICKRIVEGHQGQIAVGDASDKGARFVVTLPRA
jgi:two-component system OmpR family sensor kinase